MILDLPSPLLRSFVAVVDSGSLTAAALRIGRSESALSLQMARLADIVGQPLFSRDGRSLKLNQTGARLLPHARAILARIDAARTELGQTVAPLRLGMVQDFVEPILRPVLAGLEPEASQTMTVIIGSSADLVLAMGEDQIDTALVAGDLPGAVATRRLPVHWFGVPSLADAEILPLLAITPPCPYLALAQHALDRLGRPWRLALVTPGLDGLRAAVQAELGITCRSQPGIGLPALTGTMLPQLPEMTYAVAERRRGKSGPSAAARLMAERLAAI